MSWRRSLRLTADCYGEQMPFFEDRRDAGRKLASELSDYRGTDAILLALPKGGVVVAYYVATALGLPMDVIVSVGLFLPDGSEREIGAVSEFGTSCWDDETISALGVGEEYLRKEMKREQVEIGRKVARYRGGRPLPSVAGRPVILIDDGIHAVHKMLCALQGIRRLLPSQLLAAVPLAPQEALWRVSREVDGVACLVAPPTWDAIRSSYFGQEELSDAALVGYLTRARRQSQKMAG